MKLLKLTVFSSLLFSLLLTTVSCEREAEKKKVNVYTKSDIIMTGAQAVPQSASTGSGTLSVYYDKRTHMLNYTVKWFGLSANPTSIGIYGPAPSGYMAFTPALAPAPPIATITGLQAATTGSHSGSILIDNISFKEQALLNYWYYVRVNTSNTTYPGGEIRGQITFQ
jgi:hypothetical protein